MALRQAYSKIFEVEKPVLKLKGGYEKYGVKAGIFKDF
jgi:hypothetical protein